MTALTLAPPLFDRMGGEPTLDDVLVGAWEGLAAHRSVQCPVCHGVMDPVLDADTGSIGGRCRGCRSMVS